MAAAFEPPPTATVPLVAASAVVSRPKWRSLTMRLPPESAGLERRDGLADLGDELVADRRVGQHVVRRDADLTGVDQLGPRDALGGDVDVGVGRDDHRALAAQLQGDRRQVLRRALVDLAADLGAAGEAQPVEALRDELLADRAVTLDDGDRVVVQVARHQLGHQRRRRRRHLGRLEHDGVACGDGADGGAERQREREVPGADDQHGAVGLVLDPAAAGQLRELQQPVLALGPLADVLRGVGGLAGGAGDVGQPRLERLAAEILLRARRRWRARCRSSAVRGPAAAACATATSRVRPVANVLRSRRRRRGCRRSTWLRLDAGAADSVVMRGPS